MYAVRMANVRRAPRCTTVAWTLAKPVTPCLCTTYTKSTSSPPHSPAMLRSSLGALARRGFASGGGAREVVAAVSELRLPEPLQAREAARAGAAGGAQDAPLELPVQLAPYQALPVDGRITRHFTRGLPVVDPAGRTPQVRSHTVMYRNLLRSGPVLRPARGHCCENANPRCSPAQHAHADAAGARAVGGRGDYGLHGAAEGAHEAPLGVRAA